jgi:hypothetical protein
MLTSAEFHHLSAGYLAASLPGAAGKTKLLEANFADRQQSEFDTPSLANGELILE